MFQQGGLAPLLQYTPVKYSGADAGGETATAASKSSSSDDSSDLTDKDLLKMLEKLDGLPNDMAMISKALQNFYFNQKNSPFPDTTNVAQQYMSILFQMKTANFNKKEYDNAFNQIKDNGGLNELAVSSRGELVCMNKDRDVILTTLDDLNNHSGYKPLTNAELLQLRAQAPELVNNNGVLSVIQQGIGMKGIQDLIGTIIKNIGSTTNKDSGYANTEAGKIAHGLEEFQKIASEVRGSYDATGQDLFKYTIASEQSQTQAQNALYYIYKTLPENVKTILAVKSGDGTQKGAFDLLTKLVSSQLSNSSEFDLTLVGGKTHKSNSKDSNSGKDSSDLKGTQVLQMIEGNGADIRPITIDPGNGVQMTVNGNFYSQVKTASGDAITDCSISEMLAQSGIQSVVKNNHNITFGDQKVSMDQLKNITYNNTGVVRANLPINADGTVRLEIVNDYQKALAAIKMLPNPNNKQAVKEIYEHYGLNDLIRSDGTIIESKFAPFIIAEGYTTDKNHIKDSQFVKAIDGPSDEIYDLIQRTLTTGSGKDKVVPEVDKREWWNPADWLPGTYDKVYKAAIYIPIHTNVNAAALGDNQKIDFDESQKYERQAQQLEKIQRLQRVDDSILKNE